MPIRHCQKCGLKVLIDESQSTANPFYCQRCSASIKTGGSGTMASPDSAGGSPGKGGPIKVLCPYCKASFSGRLPSKPAKGQCPICRKELVLLPTSEIKPAATFDLAKWQKENESARATGTSALSSEPPRPATPAPRPASKVPVRQAASTDDALDTALGTSPEPEPAPAENPLAEDSAVITSAEPMPPPAAAPMNDPAEAPSPEAPAVKRPLGRGPRPSSPPSASIPQTTGSGKIFLAIILFLLPAIGGFAAYGLKDGALQTALVKVGGIASRGFVKIYQKLKPPPPPPKEEKPKEQPKIEEPKDETPKADPKQREKDEQAINDAYMKWRRAKRDLDQRLKGASDEEKKSETFRKIESDVKDLEKKYLDLREAYKKAWNADHNPATDD